jgi:hypothetical protein
MRTLAILVLVAGCSKSGDDCQKLVDKMWPLMKEMAQGKDLDGQKDKFVEQCRKDDRMKKDPVMKCVLDASDDDAVKACMTKGFDDYRGKAKATEAKLQLRKLEKQLKVYYIEKASFPKGQAGPMPAKPCCEGPNGKCPVEPASAWAANPVWKELDFQIDEPAIFQYSYASDGNTVTATAVGDPSCGGHPVTYKLEGKAEGGNPTFTTTDPQSDRHQ